MKKRIIVLILICTLVIGISPITSLSEAKDPFVLEAPKNLTAELKFNDDIPYFELRLDIPESVEVIDKNLDDNSQYYEGTDCYPVEIHFEYKYGNYDWNEAPSYYWSTDMRVTDYLEHRVYEFYPYGEEYIDGTIDIKAETYYFRANFFSNWGPIGDWIDNYVVSDYSNVVTIGNPSYYKGASDWAKPELDKAVEYGFITDKIKGDMSANITREEFAEVAIKLYEKFMNKSATYSDISAFTDTKNPEIFKAYELKIVNGVGNNKFAPNDLINREQMAAMLYRSVNAIKPDADFTTAGAPVFSDENEVSSYAVENVKFMSKHGFINGVGNNRFAPKQTSTREMAVAIAVRVYERYAN